MFTGIVQEVGAITRLSGCDVAILAEDMVSDLALGDSVAVDGACLTVAALLDDSFVVQVSPETLARTTLGNKRVGDAVNLEQAMAVGDRFDGHFVQGHVDGVGRIKGITRQGGFQLWHFQAPLEVAQYLVPKGSVTIDGISLTVVEPEGDTFAVALIPATLEKTTFNSKGSGDAVNMESDVIGKHIFHYLKAGNGVTMEKLKRHGFA
jgi:riboflavin synthase